MSRSYKKAIFKDKGLKKEYWKTIRRKTKSIAKRSKYDEELADTIPDPKTIINDYDYSDYTTDFEHLTKSPWISEEEVKKFKKLYRRK